MLHKMQQATITDAMGTYDELYVAAPLFVYFCSREPITMEHSLKLNKLMLKRFERVKHQPHDSDNLDERIGTISCQQVHGATRARPVKQVFVHG